MAYTWLNADTGGGDTGITDFLQSLTSPENSKKPIAGPNPALGPHEIPAPHQGMFSKIASPLLSLGGTAATMLGQPEIGIPLQMAGGAVGGSGGGIGGMVKGAGMAGGKAALNAGVGGALDWMKSPVNDPIDMASKGLTIPGGRTSPMDLGNLTVPASPKALLGGS